MNTAQLTIKLSKLNIPHSIIDVNEFNKDIKFTINGLEFYAAYTANDNTISDFCRVTAYDKINQEHSYRFFNSLNSVLKYANN